MPYTKMVFLARKCFFIGPQGFHIQTQCPITVAHVIMDPKFEWYIQMIHLSRSSSVDFECLLEFPKLFVKVANSQKRKYIFTVSESVFLF